MWKVIARYRDVDYIIHDDRVTDEECKVISPTLIVEDNKSGTLEFTICPSNNGYDKIYPMLTECRVLKNGKIIWFGRVLTADSDFYKRMKIHCEGGLSYLCDFYYPTETLPDPNYKYAFPQAVDGIMYWYNETLTDSKFISYGLFRSFTGKTVAFDGKEVVGRYDEEFIKKAGSDSYRAWPYPERSSMTILDWLLSSTEYYNGHLFATRETAADGTWIQYLNFKSGYNTWTGQTIRFGENLLDYTKSIDGSNFHTAVRPYGSVEITNGDQNETIVIDIRYILKNFFNDADKQDFVVTNSATDPSQNYVMTFDKSRNIAYCHSFETNMPEVDGSMQTWADVYGIICKSFEINSVGSEFVGRLISHFRETKPESMVIEIRAVDMDLLGATSSDIEILDMIHVISKPHNVDGYFPVTKIEYHLDDPSQTAYTIDTGAVESQSSVTGSSATSVDTKITSSGYKHPMYKENSLGFYKFANDAIGSITDAQPVTKKDITALGIPGEDTNTTYKLTQYQDILGSIYAVFYPVVALEDSSGNYTKIVVPNVRISAHGRLLYNECYGNLQNTDKYASLGDILFTTPHFFLYSTYNICAEFIVNYDGLECIVNVHLWSNLNGYEHAEIYTTSELSMPNVKWTVLLSRPGAPEGFEKNTCVIRICVDQESMKKIRNVHGGVFLEYSTGYDGGTIEPVQKADSVDTYLQAFHNDSVVQTDVILSSLNASDVAFTGDYNDLSNKPTIPDISGKQDKTTAVTHTANTAVGSTTKPVYIAANGAATPISHSINSDVPANAKFTDTTYNDATQSTHGLMTAADKKKLDGMDLSKYLPLSGGVMTGDIDIVANQKELLVGSRPTTNNAYATPVVGGFVHKADTMTNATPSLRSYIGSYRNTSLNRDYLLVSVRHRNGYQLDGGDGSSYGMMIYSELTSAGDLYWNKQVGKDKWLGERVLLDSTNYSRYAAKVDHTHTMITNSALLISGANNIAKWVKLGTLVSSGNFSNGVIRVWAGDGANGLAYQNSSFEIQIKDGWQSTESATKACGVTVYRINCSSVKVKVIPTAHDTYTVWVYMPWGYWNGNYAVYGKYKSWTSQHLIQSNEPKGTGADIAYYDQAFLTSTVAKATEATTLTETAWTALDYSTADKSLSNKVKYKKYGKIVYIEGLVTPSGPTGSFCVGSVPSDLMPTVDAFGYCTTSNGIVVGSRIIVAAKGKVDIFSSSDTGINPGYGYNIKLSYLLD